MDRLCTEHASEKRHCEFWTFSSYLWFFCCAVTKAAKQLLSLMDFMEVKAILEPYWFMFNFVLEYDHRPITYALVPQKIWRNGPAVLVHYVRETLKATGAAAYPAWVPHELRRASQKHNYCDYSIALFLYHLSLRLREVEAEIDWLAVDAKPRLLFHWHGKPLALKVRHSVFSITTPSGGEYVADFTIEQFGYPSSMWFLTAQEYIGQCTTGEEMEQPSDEEKMRAMKEFSGFPGKAWVVGELCRRLDLTSWKFWDQETKIDWMEARVQETFWRERQGRSLDGASMVHEGGCNGGLRETAGKGHCNWKAKVTKSVNRVLCNG